MEKKIIPSVFHNSIIQVSRTLFSFLANGYRYYFMEVLPISGQIHSQLQQLAKMIGSCKACPKSLWIPRVIFGVHGIRRRPESPVWRNSTPLKQCCIPCDYVTSSSGVTAEAKQGRSTPERATMHWAISYHCSHGYSSAHKGSTQNYCTTFPHPPLWWRGLDPVTLLDHSPKQGPNDCDTSLEKTSTGHLVQPPVV